LARPGGALSPSGLFIARTFITRKVCALRCLVPNHLLAIILRLPDHNRLQQKIAVLEQGMRFLSIALI
jgi:hypothetical protein